MYCVVLMKDGKIVYSSTQGNDYVSEKAGAATDSKEFCLIHKASGKAIGATQNGEYKGTQGGWTGRPFDDACSLALLDKLVPLNESAKFFWGGTGKNIKYTTDPE